MLYCNKIYVSKGIGANKISASKESICLYWYNLDKGRRF